MTNTESSSLPLTEAAAEDYIESQPALWNPNAAGCWSLVFTPLFGAYLHMKNWETLGDLEKSKKSKNWVIGSLVFLIAVVLSSVFLPETKGVEAFARLSGFVLIVSWYYSIGKIQQSYVTARFGNNYARRGWSKPLFAALLAVLAFFLLIFLIAVAVQFVAGAS